MLSRTASANLHLDDQDSALQIYRDGVLAQQRIMNVISSRCQLVHSHTRPFKAQFPLPELTA